MKEPLRFQIDLLEEDAEDLLGKMEAIRARDLAEGASLIRPSGSMFGWGYGPVVTNEPGAPTGWRRFRIDLPKGRSAPDEFAGAILTNESQRAIPKIAATMALVFFCLDSPKTPRRGLPSQGLLVEGLAFSEEGGFGRCGLQVRIDPRATECLKHLSEGKRVALGRKMTSAITGVYSHLNAYDLGSDLLFDCGATISSDGRVHMRTFGNCACLGTDGFWRSNMDPLQELHPHNIDSPAQQLSLLAGVAKLWEELDSLQSRSH